MPVEQIDDTDPTIVYSDGWGVGGVNAEFQSTTHLTKQAGAHLLVTFEGISIEVYGTITLSGAVSKYSVDGSSASTYTSPAVARTDYRILFFRSPILPSGRHSLLVTSLLDKTFYVDYFVITSEDKASSGIGLPTSQNNSPTTQDVYTLTKETTVVSTLFPSLSPSPPFLLISSQPDATPTPNQEPNSSGRTTSSSIVLPTPQPLPQATTTATSALGSPSSNQRLLAGSIAGFTIAGSVIAFIAFFLWRYHRRSMKYAKTSTQDPIVTPKETNVTPFVLLETYSDYSGQTIPISTIIDPSGKRPVGRSDSEPSHLSRALLAAGGRDQSPLLPTPGGGGAPEDSLDGIDDSLPPAYYTNASGIV
ncbi:hypothetical protein BDZ94DRAFT_1239785 [Collybia nuda]|uniref:Uncharacterized protein n=1 Tax=Collybia nuda TaxID=64659 RepID=A0A9P5XXN9_9AGAR|nr:hypothetical protein BDZ94DRAFT_1239785 [Collybia nuda]